MFENSSLVPEYFTVLRPSCVSETKDRVRKRKKVCTEVLRTVEPIMARSIPYELCRKGKVFVILFHGIEKQFLQACVQALSEAVPSVTRDTQVKLVELQELIQNYLQSLVDTAIFEHTEKCLDLFDLELEKQRLCLQQSLCEKTRKKWHKHCRRYLEDLAFIKGFFNEVVLLLHTEIER